MLVALGVELLPERDVRTRAHDVALLGEPVAKRASLPDERRALPRPLVELLRRVIQPTPELVQLALQPLHLPRVRVKLPLGRRVAALAVAARRLLLPVAAAAFLVVLAPPAPPRRAPRARRGRHRREPLDLTRVRARHAELAPQQLRVRQRVRELRAEFVVSLSLLRRRLPKTLERGRVPRRVRVQRVRAASRIRQVLQRRLELRVAA